jgi:hypothetical protein
VGEKKTKGLPAMECPYCRSRNFYLKDPDDGYETHEFDLREGKVVFLEKEEAPPSLPLEKDTTIFCSRCAWRGRMEDLKG